MADRTTRRGGLNYGFKVVFPNVAQLGAPRPIVAQALGAPFVGGVRVGMDRFISAWVL